MWDGIKNSFIYDSLFQATFIATIVGLLVNWIWGRFFSNNSSPSAPTFIQNNTTIVNNFTIRGQSNADDQLPGLLFFLMLIFLAVFYKNIGPIFQFLGGFSIIIGGLCLGFSIGCLVFERAKGYFSQSATLLLLSSLLQISIDSCHKAINPQITGIFTRSSFVDGWSSLNSYGHFIVFVQAIGVILTFIAGLGITLRLINFIATILGLGNLVFLTRRASRGMGLLWIASTLTLGWLLVVQTHYPEGWIWHLPGSEWIKSMVFK